MKKSLSPVLRGAFAVRADAGNVVAEQLAKAFADFKTANDAKLADLSKGLSDSVSAAKVDAVNAEVSKLQKELDKINLQMVSSQLGGAPSRVKDKEYTDAFQAHFKRGDVQASLNKGAAAEGGFLAPTEWDRTITDKLVQVSPMRQISTVQTIGGNGFSKLFNKRGTVSGWVGETAARPETATAQFGSLTYATGELYANPAATQQMLDDSEVNLESWLAMEVETEFAYQEGVAFVSGNGTNKPNGLLTYITGAANAAAHPYGAIAIVNSGNAGALTADGILNLVHAVPSEMRAGASFVLNNDSMRLVRLLKDGQGNYLWQPSYQAGTPSTLAGYPVVEMPAMPDVAANSTPIAFGDFKRGYLVVDRVGTRILRDPFTNKPYVHFYTTKRVGGGLLNPEGLRVLKVAV